MNIELYVSIHAKNGMGTTSQLEELSDGKTRQTYGAQNGKA